MADTTASLGIQVNVIGADKAQNDLAGVEARTKSLAQSSKDLGAAQQQAIPGATAAAAAQAKLAQSATATGQSTSLLQRIVAGFANMFRSYGDGAEGATTSLNHLAGAHGEVAKSMHLVNAIAASAGLSIGGIGQFAMLARGGLAILAAGIAGTLIVSLEKASDSVRLLGERLKSLQGESSGQNTLELITQSAARTGASITSVGENVRDLSEKLGALPQAWTGLAGAKAATIVDTIAMAFKKSGEDADKAQASIKSYIAEIGNLDPATRQISGLTQKLFDQIRKDSPEVAKLIAEGFGKLFPADQARSLQRFSDELAKTPKSADQLYFAMQRLSPQLEKLQYIPTVTQSFVELKNSIVNLWSAIGNASQLTAVAQGIQTLVSGIQSLAKNPQTAIEVLKGLGVVIARLAFPATTAITAIGLFSKEIASLGGGSKDAIDNLDFILRTLTTIAAFTINPFAGIIAGMVLFGTKIDDTISRINNLIAAFNRIPEWARGALTGAALGAAAGFLAGGPAGALAGGVAGGGVGLISGATGVGGAGAMVPQIPQSATQQKQFGIGTTTQVGAGGSISMIEIPQQAEKATDSVNKLNDTLNKVPEEINKIDNTKIAIDDSPITNFVTDANTDVSRIGSDVESIVSAVTNSVINMVRSAQAAINQIRSSGSAASGGAGGGPSFTVNDNINQGSGDLPRFASGGLATVSGPAGTDRTLVQFMATNGEVVAIGTPGNNLSAARAATGGSSGVAVNAITQPITMAVNSSTQQIVTAINNSGGTGTGGTSTSGSGSSGSASGTQYQIINKINYYKNDQTGGVLKPVEQILNEPNSILPQSWATGGSFTVGSGWSPGMWGQDSQLVKFLASPEETVTIQTPSQRKSAIEGMGKQMTAAREVLQIGGSRSGSNGPVHLHFYAPMNAQSFVASQSQIKRAIQKAFS